MYFASIVVDRVVELGEDVFFVFHIFLVICNQCGDLIAQYDFHADSRKPLDIERAFANLYAMYAEYRKIGSCVVLVEDAADIAILEQNFTRIRAIDELAKCIHFPSGYLDDTTLSNYIIPSLLYAGDLHVPFLEIDENLMNAIVAKYHIVHKLNGRTGIECAHRNAFVYAQVVLAWKQRRVPNVPRSCGSRERPLQSDDLEL